MVNYRYLFGVQKRLEQILKEVCPNIAHRSGIYFYIREDETGKYAYIGKSVDVLQRSISHLQGRTQRIDGSLKKRGFYSEDNLAGWKLNVLYFPKEMLDEKESWYIDNYTRAGYILYNIESGGTTGKTMINERKPTKTYLDGLKQGRHSTQKEISKLFEKNLVYQINGKPTVNKQKAFNKFANFLEGDKDDKVSERDGDTESDTVS